MKNKFSIAMSLAVILAMLLTSLVFAAGTPTIASDLPDYAPGATVNLFGTGWQAGESVHLFVNDDFGSSWSRNVDVVAVGDGTITDTFQLPNWFVANYSVTATGATSGIATTTFTDAANPSSSVTFPVQNAYYNDAGWDAGCSTAGVCGTATGGGTGQSNFNLTGIKVSIQKGTGGTATCWGGTLFNQSCTFFVVGSLSGSGHGPLNWSFTFGHANFPEENQYKVVPQAVDTGGSESGNTGKQFFIDRTAPSTSITCNAAACSGTYPGSVTVGLAANDPTLGSTGIAGSGVQKIKYTTDGSDPTSSGTATTISGSSGSFNISTTKTVNWATYDYAGNVGSLQSQIITIAPADSTPPVISYTVNGVYPEDPDGNNGWYKSNVALVWTVTDPESSVTKIGCVDQNITADQLETPYSCSASSAGGSAGLVTVSIKRDATAPTITGSRSPAANSYGWNNTSVNVTFTCSDNLSGIASCGTNTTLANEADGQSVTGTATDAAGNSASATVSPINIDETAPTISGLPDRAANSNGWYNADVVVTFVCGDTLSGIASCTDPATLGEGANQSANGTAIDKANNSASATVSGLNIDKTPPTITGAATTSPNASGWYKGDVTIHWTCGDALSGVAGPCPADSVITGEGNNLSATASVSDVAGNTATATVSGIKIDRTAPSISGAPDRAANSSGWYNADVTVSFTCSDALSDMASCPTPVTLGEGANQNASGTAVDKAGNTASTTVSGINIDKTAPVFAACPAGGPFILNSGLQSVGPIAVNADISGLSSSTLSGSVDTSSIGGKTLNFSALDNAGNLATTSCGYSVIYKWDGFFQPIDMNMLNTVKAGSAVPVKFSLGGDQGLNIFADGYPKMVKTSCTTNLVEDAIEVTVTSSTSSLTYDPVAGQYIYVWKTDKSWANSCGQLQVKLTDGTIHFANFKFK